MRGLTDNTGWEKEKGEENFTQFFPMFEIVIETDFVLSEARRLRGKFPKNQIVPVLYRFEDNILYLVREN